MWHSCGFCSHDENNFVALRESLKYISVGVCILDSLFCLYNITPSSSFIICRHVVSGKVEIGRKVVDQKIKIRPQHPIQ